MPKKKVTVKKDKPTESTKTTGGSPAELADKVETQTPLVAEPPTTPETKKEGEGEEKPKQTRRKRIKKLTEEELAKIEGDKAVAAMLVDMQLGISTRFGGEVWQAEAMERTALVNAWTHFLNRFDVMPWWVELALAQAAYFGPRILILRMRQKQAQEAAQPPESGFQDAAPAAEQVSKTGDPTFGG